MSMITTIDERMSEAEMLMRIPLLRFSMRHCTTAGLLANIGMMLIQIDL